MTPCRLFSALFTLALCSLASGQGACCLNDGSGCTDTPDEVLCVILGGTWMGAGSNCDMNPCLRGACCIEQEGCMEQVLDIECFQMGGIFLGPDSGCDSAPWCGVEYGACCFNGSECFENVPENDCIWSGGEFIGPGTTCNSAPWCVTYYGSCCFGDYCVDGIEESQCESSGGIFWFDPCNLLEDVDECVPKGACCLYDGTCRQNVTPEDCSTLGGVFQGIDTWNCFDCPESACCLEWGCEMMPLSVCINLGGEWQPGEYCNQGACAPPPCDADLDGDGFVGGPDLAILLGSWKRSEADLDGDGTVDGLDLSILLGAWGECP